MEKILQKKKAMEELEKVAKYVLAENILILSKINQEIHLCFPVLELLSVLH